MDEGHHAISCVILGCLVLVFAGYFVAVVVFVVGWFWLLILFSSLLFCGCEVKTRMKVFSWLSLFFIELKNSLDWNRDLKELLSPMSSVGQGQLPLDQFKVPSSLTLNISREETSTASLRNLFQCLTTVTEGNFTLIFSLNIPCIRIIEWFGLERTLKNLFAIISVSHCVF